MSSSPATRRRKNLLDATGKNVGVRFSRVGGALLALDPIDRDPHIAVLTAVVNQDVWSLRDLGFTVDPISTATLNTAATDPLADYDVIFNAGPCPSAVNPVARARLRAFFARGGGYIGAGSNGGNFLVSGTQVSGFTAVPATMTVDGRLPVTDYFAAGLWAADAQSASAAGSAVIAHGTNTAGTSRIALFAMNPLYRADPEREWPAAGTAAYWADR